MTEESKEPRRYTANGLPYAERKKPSYFSEDGNPIVPQYEHAGPQ